MLTTMWLKTHQRGRSIRRHVCLKPLKIVWLYRLEHSTIFSAYTWLDCSTILEHFGWRVRVISKKQMWMEIGKSHHGFFLWWLQVNMRAKGLNVTVWLTMVASPLINETGTIRVSYPFRWSSLTLWASTAATSSRSRSNTATGVKDGVSNRVLSWGRTRRHIHS